MEKLKQEIINSILIYNKYYDRAALNEHTIALLLNWLHPDDRVYYKAKYKELVEKINKMVEIKEVIQGKIDLLNLLELSHIITIPQSSNRYLDLEKLKDKLYQQLEQAISIDDSQKESRIKGYIGAFRVKAPEKEIMREAFETCIEMMENHITFPLTCNKPTFEDYLKLKEK
jgi:hypothetical protein